MGWFFVCLLLFFLILFCSEVVFRWLPKSEKLMFLCSFSCGFKTGGSENAGTTEHEYCDCYINGVA